MTGSQRPVARPSILGLIARLRADSLLRNSLYIMGTTIVSSGGGYLFWTLAARTHSVHDVGLAAALITAVTLASILSSKGIGGGLVHLLPGCTPRRRWSLMLTAGLVASALGGAVVGLIGTAVLPACSAQFAVLLRNPAYTLTFVLGVVFWNVADMLDAAYVAERASGRTLARNGAATALKNAALLVFLAVASLGALGIFGASMAGCAGGVAVGFVLVRRLGGGYRPAFRGVLSQARAMLATVVGSHLIIVSAVGPSYLLPALVTMRLSATDNAYFYTTWMVGGIFFMISPAVSASLFAEGSHVGERIGATAWASIRIICVLLGPAMILFLLGGRYILALFGPDYADQGRTLLAILVTSAVPDAITNVYVSTLRVRDRLRQAALLNLGMAALTLALAWVLLPSQGIAGAGWAWLSAQVAGSILVGIELLRVRAGATGRAAPAGTGGETG